MTKPGFEPLPHKGKANHRHHDNQVGEIHKMEKVKQWDAGPVNSPFFPLQYSQQSLEAAEAQKFPSRYVCGTGLSINT